MSTALFSQHHEQREHRFDPRIDKVGARESREEKKLFERVFASVSALDLSEDVWPKPSLEPKARLNRGLFYLSRRELRSLSWLARLPLRCLHAECEAARTVRFTIAIAQGNLAYVRET